MHDNVAVPGAAEFLHRIIDKGMPLVLLTNYPSQTGQDLANRFATAGINVPDSVFYTSAMATADFLKRQEGKKAYVVGEGALIHELYKAGFTITDCRQRRALYRHQPRYARPWFLSGLRRTVRRYRKNLRS